MIHDPASIRGRKLFGCNVRSLRVQKRISQEVLADACGLHRTYIGQIEQGKRNISIDNMERIAAALDAQLRNLVAADQHQGECAPALLGEGKATQILGDARIIAASLVDVATEMDRQELPVIAAKMRQAAGCVQMLVNLLKRR